MWWAAGALCLELLTTGGARNYPWYEALRTPDDLAAWLAACRLRLDEVRVVDDDPPAARQLRSAIWAAADSVVAGRALRRPSVAMINELAAQPPPTPLLAGNRRGPYAARIRECAASGCQLIFVDLSRPGQRRWCSMQRCGNRAKQRARRG